MLIFKNKNFFTRIQFTVTPSTTQHISILLFHSYFTRQDLKELFVLDDVTKSATQMQLEELHASQRNHNLTLKEHVEYLHTLSQCLKVDYVTMTHDHVIIFFQRCSV